MAREMHWGRAWWRLVGALVVALGAIGCDSTPRPTDSTGPGPAQASGAPTGAAAAPGDCAARIAAVDLSKDATILAVDACRFTPGGRTAAQAALAAGATGGPLWAAVWVYGASGRDPAPLRPLLQASDASVRVMAAAGLVGFGDASGFESLRLALADGTALAASEPPTSVSSFAATVLGSSIAADALPADAAGWDAWLRSNAATLVFEATTGTWSPS